MTIIGYTDLPSRMPKHASQLYGTNIVNLLKLMTPAKDGQLEVNLDDVIVRGITVTHQQDILWPPPPVQVSAAPATTAADTPTPSNSASSSNSATPAAQAAAGTVDSSGSATGNSTASTPETATKETKATKKLSGNMIGAIIAAAALIAAVTFSSPAFGALLTVFVLSVVIGFYVISGVSHSLHTPLMAQTNAISGIILVGALLQIGSNNWVVTALAFVAAAVASINIFGGFLVTGRMLAMFRRDA